MKKCNINTLEELKEYISNEKFLQYKRQSCLDNTIVLSGNKTEALSIQIVELEGQVIYWDQDKDHICKVWGWMDIPNENNPDFKLTENILPQPISDNELNEAFPDYLIVTKTKGFHQNEIQLGWFTDKGWYVRDDVYNEKDNDYYIEVVPIENSNYEPPTKWMKCPSVKDYEEQIK